MSKQTVERLAMVSMVVGAVMVWLGTSDVDYPLRELVLGVGVLAFALGAAVLL